MITAQLGLFCLRLIHTQNARHFIFNIARLCLFDSCKCFIHSTFDVYSVVFERLFYLFIIISIRLLM